jgi:hypothetical protein
LPGLSDVYEHVSEESFKDLMTRALSRLRKSFMISAPAPTALQPGRRTVDTHASKKRALREYFLTHFPDAVTAMHNQVFLHLRSSCGGSAESLEQMKPMFLAIKHGLKGTHGRVANEMRNSCATSTSLNRQSASFTRFYSSSESTSSFANLRHRLSADFSSTLTMSFGERGMWSGPYA